MLLLLLCIADETSLFFCAMTMLTCLAGPISVCAIIQIQKFAMNSAFVFKVVNERRASSLLLIGFMSLMDTVWRVCTYLKHTWYCCLCHLRHPTLDATRLWERQLVVVCFLDRPRSELPGGGCTATRQSKQRNECIALWQRSKLLPSRFHRCFTYTSPRRKWRIISIAFVDHGRWGVCTIQCESR